MISGTAEFIFLKIYLVVKDGYDDPYQLPRHLVTELQKTKIFPVCFGTFLENKNRCDIVVCSVFDLAITSRSLHHFLV